jgi:DNA helicase II / ATP-dependent DNA helicase PcrA
MNSATTEVILHGLNQPQADAVLSIDGETLVIAGAGSGKTAVLTRRVAHLISQGEDPGSILCLTFTNKAAAEMNHRVATLLTKLDINLPQVPVWSDRYGIVNPLLCTFHSLGVRILREHGTHIGIRKEFNILDPDDQEKIIKQLLKDNNLDPKNYPPRAISGFISACKQELLLPANSHKLPKEYPEVVHTLYRMYQNKLTDNQVVDFDDLIVLPYILLSEHPEVRKTLHNRWKHIMVDEFQDTNQAQFEVVRMLYEG